LIVGYTLIMSILSEIPLGELELIIEENPKLRGIMQGYIAEYKLIDRLRNIFGVTEVSKIPDRHRVKRDLQIKYLGTDITIECKSIISSTVKWDTIRGTWQGTVQCKNSDAVYSKDYLDTPKRTNLTRGGFDIMSISTYAIDGLWDAVYIENRYMPQSTYDRFDIMKTSFVVNPLTTPCIEMDLEKILKSTRDYKLK